MKRAPNLMLAEMWRDLFDGEGIPSRLMPETGLPIGQEFTAYRVLVPDDKRHLVEEILRKL